MSNRTLITTLASVLIVIWILTFSINGSYNFFMKKICPVKYEEYVYKYSNIHKVEPALVYAIIKSESGFSENAISKAGAIGLMQVMPNTFKWLQLKKGMQFSSDLDLSDPEVNINSGIFLISLLLERYKSESTAICAYNAGIGTIDKWLSDRRYSKDGVTLNYIPYQETQQYLIKVIKTKKIYSRLYFEESW